MPNDEPHLSAALGSRIYHDLASPLGALMAGVDLLEMAGGDGAEVALMRESVQGARATLDMMRLAFGHAGKGGGISAGNLHSVLADHLAQRPRLTLDWTLDGEMPRVEAQGLMLAALCMVQALPRGGTLGFARADTAFRLTACGALAVERALWDGVSGRVPLPAPDARRIEFHLLARHLASQTAKIVVTEEADRLILIMSQSLAD